MLKNILLVVLVLLAVLVTLASFVRDEDAVNRSAAQPWPLAMGALEAVSDRFPRLVANEASREWTALAQSLPASGASDEFVRREIVRGDLEIGEPPELADISSIRELLTRKIVVWESHVPFDSPEVGARRVLLLKVARALIASALAKARVGDPSAWDDLHAVWILARTQDGHPQMMAQTAALTMARMINAVAWKLPLPVPAWFCEVTSHDPIRQLLDAFQYSAASYSESGSQLLPTRWLAKSVDRDRGIAEELAKSTQCDVTAPENDLGPSLVSVWRRAFRYRAEREATANALRLREGKPVELKSAWSDGGWSVEGAPLRFCREIPLGPDELPMPLVLRVGP